MADVMLPPEPSPWAIRWTRDGCAKLEEAGFLTERYELVEGSINRVGQNMPHATVDRLCLRALISVFGDEFVVTQASIDVRPEDNPTNEPMPDLIVLTRPSGQFDHYPKPHEIQLLIEVADSTIRFDLTTKAALYARAGIVEYWVATVNERTVTVHRNPVSSIYQEVSRLSENDAIAPISAPDKSIMLSELFPSPA